jgi:hypothetical protein
MLYPLDIADFSDISVALSNIIATHADDTAILMAHDNHRSMSAFTRKYLLHSEEVKKMENQS